MKNKKEGDCYLSMDEPGLLERLSDAGYCFLIFGDVLPKDTLVKDHYKGLLFREVVPVRECPSDLPNGFACYLVGSEEQQKHLDHSAYWYLINSTYYEQRNG